MYMLYKQKVTILAKQFYNSEIIRPKLPGTAAMTGFDTLQQKGITQYRKNKNKKVLKAQDLVLLFLKKEILFFVLGVAHGDPIFAQVGPKISSFQRFQQNVLRTTGFQLKFLILIEFSDIIHWKPAKKNRTRCCPRAKFGPNYVQCCEKSKEAGNIIRFFHILLEDYLLEQEAVAVKPPERKFMAIIARNAKF